MNNGTKVSLITLLNNKMKYSDPIPLEFNKNNFIKLLSLGMTPEESSYTHKQIAEWCERFCNKYDDIEVPDEIESIMSLLADVDAQWDLYLANTYSLEQLQRQNFENVVLPLEWFEEWLRKVSV